MPVFVTTAAVTATVAASPDRSVASEPTDPTAAGANLVFGIEKTKHFLASSKHVMPKLGNNGRRELHRGLLSLSAAAVLATVAIVVTAVSVTEITHEEPLLTYQPLQVQVEPIEEEEEEQVVTDDGDGNDDSDNDSDSDSESGEEEYDDEGDDFGFDQQITFSRALPSPPPPPPVEEDVVDPGFDSMVVQDRWTPSAAQAAEEHDPGFVVIAETTAEDDNMGVGTWERPEQTARGDDWYIATKEDDSGSLFDITPPPLPPPTTASLDHPVPRKVRPLKRKKRTAPVKDFTIASYNLRINADKAPNRWEDRAASAIDNIAESGAGIVGFQEAQPQSMRDLRKGMAGFRFVGSWRDKSGSEGCPIAYETALWQKLSGGTFILGGAKQPKLCQGSTCGGKTCFPGTGCAKHNRTLTHVRLQSRSVPTMVVDVLNVHMPLKADLQEKCAQQISRFVQKLPGGASGGAYLCGDFNSHHLPLKAKTALGDLRDHGWTDTHAWADETTFGSFARVNPKKHRLDYILALRPMPVKSSGVRAFTNEKGKRPSDHEMVVATLKFLGDE